MDHSIDELEDCIFDYLVSEADIPKSLGEIWRDIRKDTGHRCSALNEPFSNYKDLFIKTCYNINSTYKDIDKFYCNGILHLMYSKKSKDQMESIFKGYKLAHAHNSLDDDFDCELIGNYLINNRNVHSDESYNDVDFQNILRHLIKKNKVEQIEKILKLYDLDVESKDESGKDLLDIAVENSNSLIVKNLVDYKDNKKTVDLLCKNRDLKKVNTQLIEDRNDLIIKNRILNRQILSQSRKNLMIHAGYLLFIFMLFWFSLF